MKCIIDKIKAFLRNKWKKFVLALIKLVIKKTFPGKTK
jgi:hypothetical protein